MKYFQDRIAGNHCFGCGPENDLGLKIKSHWREGGERGEGNEAICTFQPLAHHCAAPTKFVNGGVIATLCDCHAICTAIADEYRQQNRELGSGTPIWYATGSLSLEYLRPVPINTTLLLRAKVYSRSEKSKEILCSVEAGGKECCRARINAVRVPAQWME